MPVPPSTTNVRLALELAAVGWHVFPLAPTNKRPLANCGACADRTGRAAHHIEDCPCLPAGTWCHGVRAATIEPARIAAWWQREPRAVPGVATGPSGLVLIDIDSHGADLPADLATGLLPGIDLHVEDLPAERWNDPTHFRDGRDSLRLLAELRGGPKPWPTDPDHQPVAANTPSGGRHLWYRAPAPNLRQALSEPHGIAWQVDIKAGWSYGIAPNASSNAGHYAVRSGDIAAIGSMPQWLAREVLRVAQHRDARPLAPDRAPRRRNSTAAANYLTTVLERGASELAGLTDGRQRALAALAYKTGGLLKWSGLPGDMVVERLTAAGVDAGLPCRLVSRIVQRSFIRGLAQPLRPRSEWLSVPGGDRRALA